MARDETSLFAFTMLVLAVFAPEMSTHSMQAPSKLAFSMLLTKLQLHHIINNGVGYLVIAVESTVPNVTFVNLYFFQ